MVDAITAADTTTAVINWIETSTLLFTAFFTAFTAGAAAFAAHQAKKSAKVSRDALLHSVKTTELTVVSRFLERYSTQEMNEALSFLSRMSHDEPGMNLTGIQMGIRKAPPGFHSARRAVKYYFMEPYKLFKKDYLSKEGLCHIVDVAGIQILFEIIEPWEIQNGKMEIDKIWISDLRKICQNAGN